MHTVQAIPMRNLHTKLIKYLVLFLTEGLFCHISGLQHLVCHHLFSWRCFRGCFYMKLCCFVLLTLNLFVRIRKLHQCDGSISLTSCSQHLLSFDFTSAGVYRGGMKTVRFRINKYTVPHYWRAGTKAVFHTWRSPREQLLDSKHHSLWWTFCTWCFQGASNGLAAWCDLRPLNTTHTQRKRESIKSI